MVIELHLAGVTGDPRGAEQDKGRFRDQLSCSKFVVGGGTLRRFVWKTESMVLRIVVCDGSDAVASMQITTTRRCLRSIAGVPR
jgi:hypothetical protein